MIAPSKLDVWYAEAVIRVYGPWLTARCSWISARRRREVADLVARARRIAGGPAPTSADDDVVAWWAGDHVVPPPACMAMNKADAYLRCGSANKAVAAAHRRTGLDWIRGAPS